MSINTNGLTALSTNNTTWASPLVNEMPVAVASQIRGGLWLVPGTADNRLTDIPGIMLQDGMLVYLQTTYTEPGDDTVVRLGARLYQYTNTAARPANGQLANNINMWAVFEGGGGGGEIARAVDDIPALDAFAAADPGPTEGQLVLIIDPREADDADPAINNLPAGIDWDAAATANLNMVVAWDEADDDWNFVRIAPDNIDDQFVLVAGDTMTGSLTMDPAADIIFTGTNNADPRVNRTITVSVPENEADFTANYEIVLPPEQPTNANRTLRVSNAADDDDNIASPYTLEWATNAALWEISGNFLRPVANDDGVQIRNGENTTITLDREGGAIFNETGAGDANCDFRIESDTNQRMFFINASQNNILIGNANNTANAETVLDIIGGVRNRENEIGANWNLDLGNMWTVGGTTAVPNPTNMEEGMSGIIVVTATTVTWPNVANQAIRYPADTPPNITTVPAVIPFYCDSDTTILLGTPTQGIT